MGRLKGGHNKAEDSEVDNFGEDPSTLIEKPKERKKKGKIYATFSQKELASKLCMLFNLPNRLGLSEAEFQDDDFERASAGLIEAVNKVVAVRMVFAAIGPILAVADLVGKVRSIMELRKLKKNNKGQQVDNEPISFADRRAL